MNKFTYFAGFIGLRSSLRTADSPHTSDSKAIKAKKGKNGAV